ncbi:chitobiosyldiphosphodolichol beta-mannosyltransferase-like [Hydra vulgaris]|uniref:chitobiosyldiphosphodolichol beta-mannosyltransferase-like n=1 Tax=Hydra vulgaris TaxID=6087 RepID=UPI0001924B90
MDVLFCTILIVSVVHFILAALFIIMLIYRLNKNEKNICIVVLGDIGRSPRMQYHATSYCLEKYKVSFVGFSGSKPTSYLTNSLLVKFNYLVQAPDKPKWISSTVYYIFKTIFIGLQLFFVLLFCVERPNQFLVQNPPSIPTLFIVWLVSRIKGSEFVIDWHNYGFSILALSVKNTSHPLVKFSYNFEGFFGYLADKNFCVSNAMKEDLYNKWKIKANVLYDKPPEEFKETTLEEKHNLFLKLSNEGYKIFQGDTSQSTIFTQVNNGLLVLKEDRPAILISSTSWTEDEDFFILLSALEIYQQKKHLLENLPDLICIITGKGPLKEFYQSKIKEKNFENVQIVTPWLSSEDYSKIIGCSDLGICLHTSSSGLDLPMKIVDMFGSGVPVCAVKYTCLDELVKHGLNGLVFEDSSRLAEYLVDLFMNFPNQSTKLSKFRNNLKEFQKTRWHHNWLNIMLTKTDFDKQ